jgi:hypothetical protein
LQQFEQPKLQQVQEPKPVLQQPEPQKKETTKIKFLSPMPSFLGRNLEVYGPFIEGDEVLLPPELAAVFIAKGRAILI